MEKTTIELKQAYRLLNPGCVVLVSVGDGAEDNLFPVTWNMPVRKDPPMIALTSGKGHFSYPFIERTGEFGLNVPDTSIADQVLGCGSVSGHRVKNKFGRFGLGRQASKVIKAPLVEQAVATLECRVCQVVDLGASALLVAQVVAASAAPSVFANGAWKLDDGLELIHHLGGNKFAVSDHAIKASIPD